MRHLEILLLIALAPGVIGFFLRRSPGWLQGFSWAALALMLLHLGIEGYRWQMIPAYLLAVWGCARGRKVSRRRAGVRVAAAALWVGVYWAALFLGTKIPVFEDPAPTGPYSVGTTRLHFIDASRPDPFAPNPQTTRELLVVAWYPATPAPGAKPEPFWPDAPATVPVVAQLAHLPPRNYLRHLRMVKSHSYPDAPVARAHGRYPVLIFSHGYGSSPWQSTIQMQELASHGFVVFSVGHTYESMAIPFPDGRVAPLNRERVLAVVAKNRPAWDPIANQSLGVWVADTRYVVDELAKINAAAGQRFSHRLDLTRLGVFGMSFGGATAGEFCNQDPRCKAGINMDGFQRGGLIEHPLSVPFLYFAKEGGLNENDRIYAHARGDFYKIEIRHSVHNNFSDASLVLPILRTAGLLGSIDGHQMERILNAYTLAFFQQCLLGKQSRLLDGSPPADQYPEVVFTARKAAPAPDVRE